MKRSLWIVALIGLCLLPRSARCQEQAEPAASAIPKAVLHDNLLDKMVREWQLTGKYEGQPVNHAVHVRWVLNHQFLEIHEKDLNPMKGDDVAYEALVYLGYQTIRARYVAHWLDVFGQGGETLGYGERAGATIQFDFGYTGQPWVTTFRWNVAADTWQWLMQTKTPQGQWHETANMTLARTGKK